MTLFSVDEVWLGGWRGPSLVRATGSTLEWVGASGATAFDEPVTGHVPGVLLPGFTDSHVHLGLVDPTALVAGGIAHVVDLGGDPGELARLRERGTTDAAAADVSFAGALITTPGGYPTPGSWAPESWVRRVSTAGESEAAIAEQLGHGASTIKITLNSEAGPVFDERMLRTLVDQAHTAGLPVVAHPQGTGQTMRAVRAGVDTLAHTPWTERLTDNEVAELAQSTSVISTLDIHGYGDYGVGFATAVDNLSRFAAGGGEVLYGTDLGNGPLPIGLNGRELAALSLAGLDLDAIVAALVPTTGFGSRVMWVPTAPPTSASGAAVDADWLMSASVLPVSSLEESFV